MQTFKPIRKIRTIKKPYWDCGTYGHWHRTESVAVACLESRENPTGKRKDLTERNHAIVLTWLDKENANATGKLYGISGQRVSRILRKYFRYAKRLSKTDKPLPPPVHSFKILITPEVAARIEASKGYARWRARHDLFEAEYEYYKRTGDWPTQEDLCKPSQEPST